MDNQQKKKSQQQKKKSQQQKKKSQQQKKKSQQEKKKPQQQKKKTQQQKTPEKKPFWKQILKGIGFLTILLLLGVAIYLLVTGKNISG